VGHGEAILRRSYVEGLKPIVRTAEGNDMKNAEKKAQVGKKAKSAKRVGKKVKAATKKPRKPRTLGA
jgi:hypothetical protein